MNEKLNELKAMMGKSELFHYDIIEAIGSDILTSEEAIDLGLIDEKDVVAFDL